MVGRGTTVIDAWAREADLVVLVRPSLLNCQAQTVQRPGASSGGISRLTL